jgi:hypothetical protein
MGLNRLLAALIALVVAAGLVWWSRREAAKDPVSTTPKLLQLTETEMRKIELRRAGGEVTVLERGQDNLWSLTSPAAHRTDREAVQALVNALSSLTAEKVVEEKVEDFSEYGLKEPSFIALVTMKDGTLHTVFFGDEVPTGGGNFARLAGDARLFTVASFTRESVDKPANDLRDRRLLTFDPAALARVELRARGKSVEFGRNAQNNWQIVKPEPLRADGWQVEELIRRLREAKLDPALSEDEDRKHAAEFAKAAPLATIEVTAGTEAQQLEVKKTTDNRYLARSSAVEGVHLLTNDTGEGFDKTADDFRTRKLFDFGFAEPARVEIKDAGGVRVFHKDGEKWLEGKTEVDRVGVQSLIDRLRDLAAESFPASGFTTAEVEVSVTSGEKAVVEKVLIGRAGERYIAKREGETALYELKAESVNALTNAGRDVKEAPAEKKK